MHNIKVKMGDLTRIFIMYYNRPEQKQTMSLFGKSFEVREKQTFGGHIYPIPKPNRSGNIHLIYEFGHRNIFINSTVSFFETIVFLRLH